MVAHPTGEALPRPSPPTHPALPGGVCCVSLAALAAPLMARALWGQANPWVPIVAFLGTALGGAVVLVSLARSYPHERFGLCNCLTMTRAMLVAVLLAVALSSPGLADPETAWMALAVAVAALALDGFDGWSARRAGLASGFGARFDMEVDTALALALAVLVLLVGKVGPWVLMLGLLRPAFVVAGLALPRLRAPLPPALWRKALCVVQIGTLILLLAPLVGPEYASVLAASALALLCLGFARDIRWLLRQP